MKKYRVVSFGILILAATLSFGAKWPWESEKASSSESKSSPKAPSSIQQDLNQTVPKSDPMSAVKEQPGVEKPAVNRRTSLLTSKKVQVAEKAQTALPKTETQTAAGQTAQSAPSVKKVESAPSVEPTGTENEEEEEGGTPEQQLENVLASIPKVPKIPRVDSGAGVGGSAYRYAGAGAKPLEELSKIRQLQRSQLKTEEAGVGKIQDQIRDMLRVNEGLKVQYREQAADIQKIMNQAKIHEQILKELDANQARGQRSVELLDPKEILRQEKIRLIREQTLQNQAFLDNLKSQTPGAESKNAADEGNATA